MSGLQHLIENNTDIKISTIDRIFTSRQSGVLFPQESWTMKSGGKIRHLNTIAAGGAESKHIDHRVSLRLHSLCLK